MIITKSKENEFEDTSGVKILDYAGFYQTHSSWVLYILIIIVLGVFCTVLIPVTAAENGNLTCGVILPLSGDKGLTGTNILHGIELAAKEISKNKNETGYQIYLHVADDEGDPQKALSLFQEMREEEIPVVIGSYTTAITLPMAKETLLSNKTILISPRANGEEIYGISPRFYQINPPVHALSNFISEWVKYSSDRTVVIYVDDTYGRSLLNQIKSTLSNNSISLSGTFPVTSENNDYLAFSQKILDIAPDTIVIIVYDNRQIPIISNLSEAGFRGQIILTESSLLDTLDKEIPDDLARFALFSISSYTNLVPGEESDQFVSTFQSIYGEDPSRTLAGYGYDSLMIIDNAIRLAKKGNETISTDLIQKGLENSRYYGVTGPKTFDSHNAAGAAMDRWGFQNGSFELMTISLI